MRKVTKWSWCVEVYGECVMIPILNTRQATYVLFTNAPSHIEQVECYALRH